MRVALSWFRVTDMFSHRVAVIIPAFNCAPFVGDAVRSALGQVGVDLQVVVVDDGSTDDTRQVLESFGERIQVVRQSNRGPGAARNAGMRAAHAEYIAFLDADDVWLPGKLAVQLGHLESFPCTNAAYSRWHVWTSGAEGRFLIPEWARRPVDRAAGLARENSGNLYASLLLDCHILTSTVVMRRCLLDCVGWFDEDLRCGEDYDYWLRLARHGRLDCIDMVGTLYRACEGSVTRRPQPVNAEREVLLRALSRWGRAGPDGVEAAAAAIALRLDRLSDQFAHAHLWRGDPRIAIPWIGSRLASDPVRPKLWGLAAVAGVRWLIGTCRRSGQQ